MRLFSGLRIQWFSSGHTSRRLGTRCRCSAAHISNVLFMCTRKSCSPTDIKMGVLKFFACVVGLCSRQIAAPSQYGLPRASSRPYMTSLVPHCVCRLERPAWLTRHLYRVVVASSQLVRCPP